MIAFYMIGIIAASWHFSYGVWLFAAKWGITTGENARRRFGYICLAMAIGLVAIGLISMSGFFRTPYRPWDPNNSTDNIVMR
jgi:succinate dehydrogenase / fumarate reductase cytochrome b subunit